MYEIFVDQATYLYLSTFLCFFALLIAFVNRMAVEFNFFCFSWRNFNFRKEIFSAIEIALLFLLLYTGVMANSPAEVLRDYLRHCEEEEEEKRGAP